MPMLRRIRLLSLIIFWPALGFGVFAMLAQDYGAGSALLSLAAAAGVWAVVCAVADRVVTLLESMDRTLTAAAHEASEARQIAHRS